MRVVNKEDNGQSLANVIATISAPAAVAANVPVWIYVIFRKNPSTGHSRLSANISADGPVFWDRHVVYVFCCSCHFEKHERDLVQLMDSARLRIERMCLVDRPVDYAFLPDSLFGYMANALPKLQFVYLRELDLEKINRATVEKLSRHPRLKKLIVHGCRNFDALQDFSNLPQLLVVKGEIMGLKAMIGDVSGDSIETSASDSSFTPPLSGGGDTGGKDERTSASFVRQFSSSTSSSSQIM